MAGVLLMLRGQVLRGKFYHYFLGGNDMVLIVARAASGSRSCQWPWYSIYKSTRCRGVFVFFFYRGIC